MKHMASGTIAFIGVLALAGCYSYNGEAINNSNYNTVQATPNFLVLKVGDSTQVIARLVNDNNNGAITDYTVGSVGAGILVHENPNYRPVFDATKDTLVPTGAKSAEQFYVVGTAVGRYTFTLTPTLVNTGISGTITAIVTPITLGAALNRTSANAGDTVIVTAPAGTVFSQTSAISFTAGSAPAIVARSADSTKITFLAAPGDSGVLTVTKVGTIAAPSLAPVSLTTSNGFTTPTPSPTVAPTTLSTSTPAIGTVTAPFTVTLGGGLRFTSTSTVLIGTTPTIILSRSADSSSAVVVPFGGVAGGLVSYTNIVLSFLNTVPLALNGDKSVTYALAADPATLLQATAPTIVIPASGGTLVVTGAPPFGANSQCAGSSTDGCAVYKFTLAAPTTIQLTAVWGNLADLGLYRLNAAGTTATSAGTPGNCDNGGQGSSGQPETCTFPSLAAGTYFLAMDFFGPAAYGAGAPNTTAPTWFQFKVVTP